MFTFQAVSKTSGSVFRLFTYSGSAHPIQTAVTKYDRVGGFSTKEHLFLSALEAEDQYASMVWLAFCRFFTVSSHGRRNKGASLGFIHESTNTVH